MDGRRVQVWGRGSSLLDSEARCLGFGTYAVVVEAMVDGQEEAAKIPMLTGTGPDDPAISVYSVYSEAVVLNELAGHPNILPLKRLCLQEHDALGISVPVLFTPRHRASLSTWWLSITPDARAAIFDDVCYQALRGLAYCHSHGLVHTDPKADNFLVDFDCPSPALQAAHQGPRGVVRIVLADWGSAYKRGVVCKSSTHYALCVRPPEVRRATPQQPYVLDTPADVWALGATLAVLPVPGLIAGDDLGRAGLSLVSPDGASVTLPFWATQSARYRPFFQSLLHIDPGHRPTALHAMDHPVLALAKQRVEAELPAPPISPADAWLFRPGAAYYPDFPRHSDWPAAQRAMEKATGQATVHEPEAWATLCNMLLDLHASHPAHFELRSCCLAVTYLHQFAMRQPLFVAHAGGVVAGALALACCFTQELPVCMDWLLKQFRHGEKRRIFDWTGHLLRVTDLDLAATDLYTCMQFYDDKERSVMAAAEQAGTLLALLRRLLADFTWYLSFPLPVLGEAALRLLASDRCERSSESVAATAALATFEERMLYFLGLGTAHDGADDDDDMPLG